MRKLASVRKVTDVIEHPNADNLNIALVDGWKVVIRKDEKIAKNDLVVFFEIDSYLKIDPRYEFLRKSSYKKLEFTDGNPEGLRDEGFRLRTVRLRGIYSQGLVLPLETFKDELMARFPSAMDTDTLWISIDDGIDLTDILDVKLYTPPIPPDQAGKQKGKFPHGIPETDQERVQNLVTFFDEYKDLEFEESEKVDGQSMTVYRKDDEFGVCKRKWELFETDGNQFWMKARELELEKHLNELGKNIALQMEIAGQKIQENPLEITGKDVFLYDVWDIDNMRYMTPSERMDVYDFLAERCDIKHVPIVNEGIKIFQEYPKDKMDDLIARSRGKSLINKNKMREGLVFKSTTLVNGHTVSFKVLDNKSLAKQK